MYQGSIFRRLFQIALADAKLRPETSRLIEICPGLEQRLIDEFDERLWDLLEVAADKTHLSLEPMFSILNPTLPNFNPVEEDDEGDLEMSSDGSYAKTPRKIALEESGGFLGKLLSWITVDDNKAKGE